MKSLSVFVYSVMLVVFQWMKLKENAEMIQSETFMMKSSNRSEGSK